MDFVELARLVQSLNAEDAFRTRLTSDQWRQVGPYFTRHDIRMGDLLIEQGESDRTMYLLGQGTLQVYLKPPVPPGNRIALLRVGAVVGEPGLFGDGPRSANVEAMTACTVWALRSARLEEMASRMPMLALELLRAAGSVMAIRMRANMTRQIPFG